MYARELGIKRLREVSDELRKLGEMDAAQAFSIEMPFQLVGGAGRPLDLDVFNEAVPHLKIADGDGEFPLTLRVSTKRTLAQAPGPKTLDDASAMVKVFDMGLQFLCALSIASGAVILWRRTRLEPSTLRGFKLEEGAPITVNMGELPLEFSSTREVHAGHLAAAVQVVGLFTVDAWSPRFVSTYHKAQLYLATPALPVHDFFEDAYLSFFKCLEYVTMAQVLRGQRGKFDEKQFERAMLMLGAKATDGDPKALKALGVKLIRTRGEAVAHLSQGSIKLGITPQETLELKGLVDFMAFAWTDQGALRASFPRR